MRPSEFEAIRPHLQRAVDDIDADLKRSQLLENDKELEELFNRLAALPEGTPSKKKLVVPTEEEQAALVRLMLGPHPKQGPPPRQDHLSAKQKKALEAKQKKALEAKQKKALEAYQNRERLLLRHPPITCPRIEDAYPWRNSAAQAAVWLRKGDWTTEADEIELVLSGLPTGPLDGNQAENMARQLEAIRAGAERIRATLAYCLDESQPPAGKPTEAAGGGGGNGEVDGSRAKPRKVSARSEVKIEQAILALPPGALQKDIAREAGVGPRTVRASTKWRTRLIRDTRNHPSNDNDVDNDALLDVQAFVEAKKGLLHHKTQTKVDRLIADQDKGDRLFVCLLPAYKELMADGQKIAEVPDELAKQVIRSAAEDAGKCPV